MAFPVTYQRCVRLSVVCLAVLSVACASTPKPSSYAASHMAIFDAQGRPRDPETLTSCLGTEEECSYTSDRLFSALETYAGKNAGRRKIVIFIHGGLNNTSTSIARVDAKGPLIEKSGAFPIFINWRSSLPSSYWESVAHLREGRHHRWRRSWRRALFIPLEDLGTGIIRMPAAWATEVTSAFHDPNNTYGKAVDEISDGVRCRYLPDADAIALHQGQTRTGTPQQKVAKTVYPVTLPTKLLTAPILAGFGSSAWRALLYRVSVLFHSEDELDFRNNVPFDDGESYSFKRSDGGLARFARRLAKETANRDFEITLIGHSMGAIVVNQLVREYGNELPIRNIVYMAAAASIRDYQMSIWPYLRDHKDVHIYHLTLNREAEVTERWTSLGFGIFDWPLRGSLLMWIDTFLSQPATRYDQTVGRYTNLLRVIHDTPKRLWRQIHIKSFSYDPGSDDEPQKHGGFDAHAFWEQEFWEPNSTLTNCPPRPVTAARSASPPRE